MNFLYLRVVDELLVHVEHDDDLLEHVRRDVADLLAEHQLRDALVGDRLVLSSPVAVVRRRPPPR